MSGTSVFLTPFTLLLMLKLICAPASDTQSRLPQRVKAAPRAAGHRDHRGRGSAGRPQVHAEPNPLQVSNTCRQQGVSQADVHYVPER